MAAGPFTRTSSTILSASVQSPLSCLCRTRRVAALTMQDTQKTIFPAAEWKVGHGRCHADVHADVSCRRLIPELSCRSAARRKNGGGVPVGALCKRQNWPEDLGHPGASCRRLQCPCRSVAPGIGRPQGAVWLCENAFRALKIMADILKITPIDSKIEDWVRFHGLVAAGIV